jgi:prepilin-type N-terminal cleavage/methylation domain-containing protein
MKRGFTLIEISIALILLGIIAGISIPLLTQTRRSKGIEETQQELKTYKKRIIAYYKTYGKLPSHTTNYRLPPSLLQIPTKFLNDPINGIPYFYFADTTNTSDSIYIDGIPIGSIGAVIISAGPNGKFDGLNSDISSPDRYFQSKGTGDFDDILIAISQAELITSGTSTCPNYLVIVRNTSGSTIYAFPTQLQTGSTTINNNTSATFGNVKPNEVILLSISQNFPPHQTNAFVPIILDWNGNCIVDVTVTTIIDNNVPIYTLDNN